MACDHVLIVSQAIARTTCCALVTFLTFSTLVASIPITLKWIVSSHTARKVSSVLFSLGRLYRLVRFPTALFPKGRCRGRDTRLSRSSGQLRRLPIYCNDG